MLVISAVEGVQVQTRLLMRTLTRLRIPTLLFVNKIDRMGARYDDLLADIARLLTPAAIPMGSVTDLGTRAARYRPFSLVRKGLAELLAESNDDFMARYLDDALTTEDYRRELAGQVQGSLVQPVYFGSAMTGEGVPELIKGIREWLPRATGSPVEPLQCFGVQGGTGSCGGEDRLGSGVRRTVARAAGDRRASWRKAVRGEADVGTGVRARWHAARRKCRGGADRRAAWAQAGADRGSARVAERASRAAFRAADAGDGCHRRRIG